jgi:hypothetical protein
LADDHVVPFNTSRRPGSPFVTVVYKPTAAQEVALAHDTEKNVPVPASESLGTGAIAALQVPPDRVSISGRSTVLTRTVPTATHMPSEGQLTDFNWAVLAMLEGLGALVAVHVPPDRVSMRASAKCDVASKLPTATHDPGAAQDTAVTVALAVCPVMASAGSDAVTADHFPPLKTSIIGL